MENKKNFNWTTLALVILLVVAAFFVGKYMERGNRVTGSTPATSGSNQVTQVPAPTIEALPVTVGSFSITNDAVCQENNKPSIYYFGISTCPHCLWEHPIIQKVMANFKNQVVFHDDMDKLDKLEAKDQEILNKYEQIHGGGVPFLVFGCKYVRVGSGETAGQAQEEKNLTAILCKLTNNQPQQICTPVKDLVEQVK
jgi:thiol-disulfide isomerase/thioredoxin